MACGSQTILWQSFRDAIFILRQKDMKGQILRKINGYRQLLENIFTISNATTYRSFGSIVHQAHHFHCSDERDRILAMLNLLTDDGKLFGLHPDYEKPLSQILEDVTRRVVEHDKLTISNYCSLQKSLKNRLSRWRVHTTPVVSGVNLQLI